MVMMKILLTFMLLILLTGVRSLSPKVVHKKAGEMLVLCCPLVTDSEATPLWSGPTRNQTDNQSTSDTSQMLIHGRNFVIFRVSVNHQGDYSCSVGNASSWFWFTLQVHTSSSDEDEERRRAYLTTCYTQESCRLFCPAENVPGEDLPNISSRGVAWHRKGETSQTHNFFSSVEEKDSGVYICIRSYSYDAHIYNTSFTVVLQVEPNEQPGQALILLPKQNDVFYVDLGSAVVIDCEAVVSSDFDEVFWLSETSFVELDESLQVFYNYSRIKTSAELKMTASLVFKEVSEEDLLKNFTCKLESAQQPSTFITITLSRRAGPISSSRPSNQILSIGTVVLLLVVLATVVVVVFCRWNTLGCRGSSPSFSDPGSGSHLLNKAASVENQTC